jgi:hypothetical protein
MTVSTLLRPGWLRARATQQEVLGSRGREILARLGEIMLPGAREAGIATFVASQLRLPVERQTLMIKYLGVAPPFESFYDGGLRALDSMSRKRMNRSFMALSDAQALGLVRELGGGAPGGWTGPPAGLFHFVVRNDALDVVYGTHKGYLALSTPYMAHIEPPTDWPR